MAPSDTGQEIEIAFGNHRPLTGNETARHCNADPKDGDLPRLAETLLRGGKGNHSFSSQRQRLGDRGGGEKIMKNRSDSPAPDGCPRRLVVPGGLTTVEFYGCKYATDYRGPNPNDSENFRSASSMLSIGWIRSAAFPCTR